MAITVDWGTLTISIPKADLTLLQPSPEIRQLNVDDLRLELKALEAGEAGIVFPDTHVHNTEVVLAGVTYARFVEFVNGYTITFEDGQYAVEMFGANHNVADVSNVNQVSLRTFNSAGLISVETGGGGGSGDWDTTERSQIRQALGVDGAKLTTSGGNLDVVESRLTAQRAANLDEITADRLEQLDSGVAGSVPLEMDELLDVRLTTGRASNLDNLDATVSSRAIPGDAMTLTTAERQAIAGAVLAYDMGNGRTVVEALASARNRWRITGTGNPYTYEVYDTDDSTILWSAQCTIAAGGEVQEINPV